MSIHLNAAWQPIAGGEPILHSPLCHFSSKKRFIEALNSSRNLARRNAPFGSG